jgi:hypothetical protein
MLSMANFVAKFRVGKSPQKNKLSKPSVKEMVERTSLTDDIGPALRRCLRSDERCCSSSNTSPLEKQRSISRIVPAEIPDAEVLKPNDERIIASVALFIYALVSKQRSTNQLEFSRKKAIPTSDPFELFAQKGAISNRVSSYKIFLFVLAMVVEAECTAECHITALMLICRIVRISNFQLTPTNWPAVYACAFNVAQKVQDDACLGNWDFVDIFQEVCGDPGNEKLLSVKVHEQCLNKNLHHSRVHCTHHSRVRCNRR